MNVPILSKRKSDAISNGIFLIGLGILFYTNAWWPGILVAIWAALAVRQYFSGRLYDLLITSLILGGIVLISFFRFNWGVIVPVLFILGGIYIIFREYFFADDTNGEEKSEEIKDDIDDGKGNF